MHALKTPGLQRVGTLAAALGVSLLLAFASIIWGSAVAHAVNYPNAVTAVSTNQTTYPQGGEIDLSFVWSVPNGAQSGDTFSVTLPPELVASNTVQFPLMEGTNTVGIATWNGSTVTVELQPYVNGLAQVRGTLEFSAALIRNGSSSNTPIVLDFGGGVTTTVTMEAEDGTVYPAPTGQMGDKYGYFTRPDKGTSIPEGALRWAVEIPSRPLGYAGPITIADVVQPGHTLDASSLEVSALRYTDPADSSAIEYVTPFAQGTRWKLVAQGDGGYTIEIDEVRPAVGTHSAEFITVHYTTTVTGAQQQAYGNAVTITVPGETDVVTTYSVDRVSGGGTGEGNLTDPKILLKKWSAADGSIVAGDHNDTPKMLEVNTPEKLVFTITNEGDEALVDISVEDITREGPAAIGLSCDFSALGGPATGVTWAGPFAVGAEFECTTTVPGMPANTLHDNNATVAARGEISGKPVTSEDPWTGKTSPAPTPTPTDPAPPAPEPTLPEPVPTQPAPQMTAQAGHLPRTGADSAGLGVAGGALLVAGAAALAMGARRKSRA